MYGVYYNDGKNGEIDSIGISIIELRFSQTYICLKTSTF